MKSRLLSRILLLIACVTLCVSLCPAASAASDLVLPGDLEVIEEEAFYGDTRLNHVVLPEGLKRIESRAFANSSLKLINLPSTLEYIADDAFDGCSGIEITGVRGDNYAYQWGRAHGYCRRYVALLIGEAEFYGYDDSGEYGMLDWCDRNVGDVKRMQSMLNRTYTPDLTRFEVSANKDQSYDQISSLIRSTYADTEPQDVCWFFIATHGDSDGDGDLWLVDDTTLSFSTLASWLKAATPAPVVVVLESCGAGSSIYGNKDGSVNKNALKKVTSRAISAFAAADQRVVVSNSTGDMAVTGKFYVLAAAAHHEMSWGYESDYAYDYENSSNYFTLWLIEGIGTSSSAPADTSPKDGLLTLNESYRYVQKYDSFPFETSDGTYYQHVQCYPSGSSYPMVRHY